MNSGGWNGIIPVSNVREENIMEKQCQVAILIDGDNVSAKYAGFIKQEASSYGNIKFFRLYGSISSPTVKAWYSVMPTQGINPVLQISYANGKRKASQKSSGAKSTPCMRQSRDNAKWKQQ